MTTDAKPTYKHPILWVPTSYFAEGIVYTMVTTAANIMFANLGLPPQEATFYASLTGLAYSFKALWGPILELYRTKKFFVVLMQIVLAGAMAGLAFSLKAPAWLVPVMVFLMIAAVAGATQDIGTDGVYVTTLESKRQAAFSGVQSLCWSIGPIIATGALVPLVGRLAGEVTGQPKPPVDAYASGWMVVFVVIAVVLGAVALWHFLMLPPGAKATDAPSSFSDAMTTFGKAFATFFQKKDVLLLLGFAFFYRFGIGMLDKIWPIFFITGRDKGGLGLNNQILGSLQGWVGFGAFMLGSLLGGLFVAKRTLKRSLLILSLALNLPNVCFLLLALMLPDASLTSSGMPNAGLILVGLMIFVVNLGWGFGAVGHMIYMMQQIAPGPYKTAHYAFATGIGLSLCMTLTGMVSGYIQSHVGYTTYFVLVLVAAIPSVLFTVLAPFHHGDGSSAEPAAT